MSEHNTKLTSAEIASIWTSYMNDSMHNCILEYFLKDIEDVKIRSIIQQAYDLTVNHLKQLTDIFNKEQLPLPVGFTNEDVNMNAPRLYTDHFMLEYIGHLTRAGLIAFSGFVGMSVRRDIRSFFRKCLMQTSSLYEDGAELSLSKGLFTRPPYIAYPTQIDMIDSKKYLSGLNPFSEKRPLNTVEITHLHMNIKTNLLGEKLVLSFAQGSPTEKVQKLMLRGRDIAKKHIEIFTKILADNDIQAANASDITITDSTSAPFSDKLMMFFAVQLSALGVGNYATAASASQRSDLVMNYERLSIEAGKFAKDATDLMIQNEWLEQPPGTLDKNKLATEKKD